MNHLLLYGEEPFRILRHLHRVAIGVQEELRLGSVGTKIRVGLKRSYGERERSDDERSSAQLWPSKRNCYRTELLGS